MAQRSRAQVWIIRACTSIVVWSCIVQFHTLLQIWAPNLLSRWPPCIALPGSSSSPDFVSAIPETAANITLPPKRVYKNNGYLMISCNGGLNQMRAAICDMVTIARVLNVTLIVPLLDKGSFWADPRQVTSFNHKQFLSKICKFVSLLDIQSLTILGNDYCFDFVLLVKLIVVLVIMGTLNSEFKDIFDVNHFISSLRDEIRILKELPSKLKPKAEQGSIFSMPPVSWSNMSYYLHQILPLIKRHKVLHLTKTDARLTNNGMPVDIQKLRCRVNYNAIRFASQIEELAHKIVKILRSNGPFLVLHLRYEMDMLAFSGCTLGCTNEEVEELTRLRNAYPWWKEKIINAEIKRKDGLCPLTPEETALVLKAFEFVSDIQIYIAAGEIYGEERRMSALYSAYPYIVRKETLLNPLDLRPFENYSSQMAALDYLVALASDVFIPTYDGNMAKLVEGHRRFLGFRRTILLDRTHLVELIDQYNNGSLIWEEFSLAVKNVHTNRMGAPRSRLVVPNKPKDEDYFYSNPEECLASEFKI